MKILKAHLNEMFGGKPARRKAPASTLVALMPDGTEMQVTRGKNCGRTIYSCDGKSSSRLGDLASALGARIERRS